MPIPYTLIRSRRKTISIQISPAGEVTVRCPSRMSKREVQVFVDSKAEWIRRRLSSLAQKPQLPLLTLERLRRRVSSDSSIRKLDKIKIPSPDHLAQEITIC